MQEVHTAALALARFAQRHNVDGVEIIMPRELITALKHEMNPHMISDLTQNELRTGAIRVAGILIRPMPPKDRRNDLVGMPLTRNSIP